MKIKRLDHIVVTVADLQRAVRFYHEVFDLPVLEDQSDEFVTTLRCGHQLLKLQLATRNTPLKAKEPTSASADFCLVTGDKLDDVKNHLKSYFVEIIAGPVEKIGANGKITSLYVNDPDGNLIEIAVY
ncbi:MAG: VOC family protein [Lactobacillus sp.]|nr:VOC family protein [Lactobacillus sp.]